MADEKETKRPPRRTVIGIAAGLALGVGFGAAIDNYGAGIAIGIALGVAIGGSTDAASRRRDASDADHAPDSDDATKP